MLLHLQDVSELAVLCPSLESIFLDTPPSQGWGRALNLTNTPLNLSKIKANKVQCTYSLTAEILWRSNVLWDLHTLPRSGGRRESSQFAFELHLSFQKLQEKSFPL